MVIVSSITGFLCDPMHLKILFQEGIHRFPQTVKVAQTRLKTFVLNTFFFFLAVLGLRCCAQAFSSCGEQGLLFIAVRGLLIAVASLVAEHWL